MVMRKRKFNRRRFVRKRKVSPVATKQYVKKLVRKEVETKYYDDYTSWSGTAIDWTGSLVRLTTIAQGTTDITRVGDKLTLRAVRIKLNFVAADATQCMRLIVFQWYPNTTLVTPTTANILNVVGSPQGVNSMYIHDYDNQFKVLYDRRIAMVLGQNNDYKAISINVPLKFAKKTINFTAASTAGSNHIYIMAISDSGAVGHPSITMYSRVWFDDA